MDNGNIQIIKDYDDATIYEVIKFVQQVDAHRSVFPKSANFFEGKPVSLTEIAFSNVTGYLYADLLLQSQTISINYEPSVAVRLEAVKCLLVWDVGPFNNDEPAFSPCIEIALSNLGKPNQGPYPEKINFCWHARDTYVNWISDDNDKKTGFGNRVHFWGRLGLALIFDDDKIRKDIVNKAESIFLQIDKGFHFPLNFSYISEEKLQEARKTLIREYSQG